MDTKKHLWNKKGESLSENNAIKEYGITSEEIREGIQSGKLVYKLNYIHGNPYYKLLRSEVIVYMKEKYGESHFEKQSYMFRLKEVESELRKLKRKENALKKEQKNLKEKIAILTKK